MRRYISSLVAISGSGRNFLLIFFLDVQVFGQIAISVAYFSLVISMFPRLWELVESSPVSGVSEEIAQSNYGAVFVISYLALMSVALLGYPLFFENFEVVNVSYGVVVALLIAMSGVAQYFVRRAGDIDEFVLKDSLVKFVTMVFLVPVGFFYPEILNLAALLSLLPIIILYFLQIPISIKNNLVLKMFKYIYVDRWLYIKRSLPLVMSRAANDHVILLVIGAFFGFNFAAQYSAVRTIMSPFRVVQTIYQAPVYKEVLYHDNESWRRISYRWKHFIRPSFLLLLLGLIAVFGFYSFDLIPQSSAMYSKEVMYASFFAVFVIAINLTALHVYPYAIKTGRTHTYSIGVLFRLLTTLLAVWILFILGQQSLIVLFIIILVVSILVRLIFDPLVLR